MLHEKILVNNAATITVRKPTLQYGMLTVAGVLNIIKHTL